MSCLPVSAHRTLTASDCSMVVSYLTHDGLKRVRLQRMFKLDRELLITAHLESELQCTEYMRAGYRCVIQTAGTVDERPLLTILVEESI